jgi:hypothetical protein
MQAGARSAYEADMNTTKTPIKILMGSLRTRSAAPGNHSNAPKTVESPTIGIVRNRSTPGDLYVARNAGRRLQSKRPLGNLHPSRKLTPELDCG